MDVSLKCELCVGYFGDGGRWPRVLGCGHSICSLCTTLLLKNSAIICPNCNIPHPAMSPNMVPLNHTVLRILGSPLVKNLPNLDNPEGQMKALTAIVAQKLSPGNSGSREVCQGSEASQLATPSPKVPQVAAEPSHHAGICDEHGQYLLFWCNRCLEWICRDCTIVNHPHTVCSVASIRQALRAMQQKEDKLIRNTVAQFDENLRLFRNKHQLLKKLRDQHINHVKELQRIISLHRKAERLLEKEDAALQAGMSKGLTICFMLLESQGNLLEAASLQEILSSRLKAQEHQSAILSWFDQSLLNDSPDLVYSRELQEATAAALETMKQKMALAGHSLIEGRSQPPLPTTAKRAQKAPTGESQDVEKLLFDSSSDSSVTGWLVLSPTVLHGKDKNQGADEVDEQVQDLVEDLDEEQAGKQVKSKVIGHLHAQNPDEDRSTGAIKKQPERLIVKVKRSRGRDTDDTKGQSDGPVQNICGESPETTGEVKEEEKNSITVHSINRRSIISDLKNNLQNIIDKEEVSVEVEDVIRRSISIKQTHVSSEQLMAFTTSAHIENVEEKERTILLVAVRDQGDSVTKSLEEENVSYEQGTDEENSGKSNQFIQSIVERKEYMEKLPGGDKSNAIEMESQVPEQDETKDQKHTQDSDMKLLSAKDSVEPSEGSKTAYDAEADPSAKTDNEESESYPSARNDNEIDKDELRNNTQDESAEVSDKGGPCSTPNSSLQEQNRKFTHEEKNNHLKAESSEAAAQNKDKSTKPPEEAADNKEDKSVKHPEEADDAPSEMREFVEASLSSPEVKELTDSLKKNDSGDSEEIPDEKKSNDMCKHQ